MSDILEDLGIGADERSSLDQDSAPTPRRRGRPRKEDVSATPTSLKPSARAPRAQREELPMPKPGAIAEGIAGLYQVAAIPLMGLRPQTAMALMGQSEEIGKAWEQAAAANPQIRRALLSLMGTSTLGIVVMAHVPIVMTLMRENGEIRDAAAAKDAVGAGPTGDSGPTASPAYSLEPVSPVL